MRKAFSLIELLVVVAMVALLAALLLPALKRARALAKGVACMSNERQLGVAMILYRADWRGFVPVQAHFRWRPNLMPYLENSEVFNCPASRWRITEAYIYTYPGSNMGSLGQFYPLYAYNYSRYVEELGQVRSDNGAVCWWPMERGWRNPANSVYVADSYFARNAVTYPTEETPYPATCGSNHIHAYSVGTASYFLAGMDVRRFADRHLGSNCLFLDGRVQRYPAQWLDGIPINDPRCIWDTQ